MLFFFSLKIALFNRFKIISQILHGQSVKITGRIFKTYIIDKWLHLKTEYYGLNNFCEVIIGIPLNLLRDLLIQ